MEKKYILITGGGLYNKGAQSMTFVTVDQLKKRFPDKEVILISSQDYNRNKEDKDQYLFKILPPYGIHELIGGYNKWVWNLRNLIKNEHKNEDIINKLNKVLSNTDMIINISGYALSSQWSAINSFNYLMTIKLAKKYGIKVFLMPQSFGPFSYNGIKKYFIDHLIKKYMKYPNVIFAREEEGYDILRGNYRLKNVKKAYDLVLSSHDIDLSNIYITNPTFSSIDVKDVAILPNMKNFRHGNIEEVLRVYDTCINKLTKLGKTVYLVRHSFEDIEACKMIKERFENNNKVILIENEFSCIDFEYIVKQFDFIIASRYHSIIHAFKNGVPCIAIGWATKYHELLKIFRQENYIFDVRGNIDITATERAIDNMLENYKDESDIILEILKEVQGENVFDIIGGEK